MLMYKSMDLMTLTSIFFSPANNTPEVEPYTLLHLCSLFYFVFFDGYSRPSPLLPDNPAP